MKIGWHRGKKESTHPLLGKVVQVGEYHVKLESILGDGGFACVYRAKDIKDGKVFAMKHMRLAGNSEASLEVQLEAKTMAKLRGHPNILYLHAVAFAGPKGAETDAFMLLDFCPQTLLSKLQSSHNQMDDLTMVEAFADVLQGVAHMHNHKPAYAHRDLKVENVLQDQKGNWVLCDFGSATTRAQVYETSAEIAQEEQNVQKKTTPTYRAPEMWDLLMRKRIDTKVDIWALGVLLYVLAFGKLPFQGDQKLAFLWGKYEMPLLRTPELRALIAEMLTVDPDRRPDIHTVIKKFAPIKQAFTANYQPALPASPHIPPPHTMHAPHNPPISQSAPTPSPPAHAPAPQTNDIPLRQPSIPSQDRPYLPHSQDPQQLTTRPSSGSSDVPLTSHRAPAHTQPPQHHRMPPAPPPPAPSSSTANHSEGWADFNNTAPVLQTTSNNTQAPAARPTSASSGTTQPQPQPQPRQPAPQPKPHTTPHSSANSSPAQPRPVPVVAPVAAPVVVQAAAPAAPGPEVRELQESLGRLRDNTAGDVDAIRRQLKEVVVANKALHERVRALEDVVSSQQLMLQKLRDALQDKGTAPLPRHSGAGAGEEQEAASASRAPSASAPTRQAPAAPSRAFSSNLWTADSAEPQNINGATTRSDSTGGSSQAETRSQFPDIRY